ncbi:hypothetical protein H257_13205 [Aphanomyces astaci]|uniref:Peptidase S1 domain-containing protein n=1 Tax=Aphanomyces astaci TaxID=112090 RepID=W4FVM4_APHAT|nr:hypothetical protein H257_13205 [Aphanomyces astaci]ETV71542.1 hypothetical protein H257_13205 [Aphanomyces astaci]|eukprot:XP_009838975.1 hypothetical protein H257_13205 [Aphanomyces astaci]
MLCAGGKSGEYACKGNSGGPLTVESNGSVKLVGVISWGIKCAQNMPGIYSRISIPRDYHQADCRPSLPVQSASRGPLITSSKGPTVGPTTTLPSKFSGCSTCFPSAYSKSTCDSYASLGAFWYGN